MAVIFFDGFEKYGPAGTNVLLNTQSPGDVNDAFVAVWPTLGTGSVNTCSIVTGDISPLAIELLEGATIKRPLPTNYPTLIFGFRINSDLSSTSGIVLYDGTTAQVTVQLNSSGFIEVRRGTSTGTLLGTSTASVAANTWHYIEGQITINSTTGAYAINLDGVATSLVATNQNTQSSANAYANAVLLGKQGAQGTVTYFDDFYLFDNTGSANNAMRGDSVVVPIYGVSDNAVQFINGQGLIGPYWGGGTTGYGGGQFLYLNKVVAPINCTLTGVTFVPDANDSTVKYQGAVYADNGSGIAGALIGSAPEQTTPLVAGTRVNLTLSSPVTLTAGSNYWIGIFSTMSTSGFYKAYPNSDPLQTQRATVTYSSAGPPNPAPSMGAYGATISVGGIVTPPSNYFDTIGVPPVADAYVYSSTPGNSDLYNTNGLTNNPTSIACLKLSMWAYKSDTNARTMNLLIQSGSAQSNGSASGFVLSTSATYFESYFSIDPNTGAPWTTVGINNVKVGFDLAS